VKGEDGTKQDKHLAYGCTMHTPDKTWLAEANTRSPGHLVRSINRRKWI